MAAWTIERLQQFAQSLDPRARLASPGPIRRQIKEDLDLVGPALLMPHRFGWVVEARAYGQSGMGPPLVAESAHALAIAQPPDRLLEQWREEEGERWIRGMVAHLGSDLALSGRDLSEIRSRLGEPAWEEVASVLRDERRIPPHASDNLIAREFLSTWVELEASGVESGPGAWFPAVARATISGWLPPEPAPVKPQETGPAQGKEMPHGPLPTGLGRLLEGATDPEATKAGHALADLAADPGNSQARALITDIDTALGIDGEVLERVDLFGWVATLGQVPIRLTMPERGTLLAIRILKRCVRNLPGAGLPPASMKVLEKVVRDRLEAIDRRLAGMLRPALSRALGESGLGGGTFLETIDSSRIVDELLVRLVDHGSLAISDLRDAVARSRVKLPDLSGAGEFLAGDPLLRADRALSRALPGAYRRGEAYNRAMQRFSSLFFGTPWGRLLFLNLILPFAICFVSFKGMQELVHYGLLATFQKHEILLELDEFLPNPPPWWLPVDIEHSGHGPSSDQEDAKQETSLEMLLGNPAWYTGGTLLAMALIRFRAFRRRIGRILWFIGVGLHRLLIDLPAAAGRVIAWLIRLPVIRPLFHFALRPALFSWLGLFIATRQEHLLGITTDRLTRVAIFAGQFLIFISPAWRRTEEFLLDALAWAWNHLGLALILAIVDWILAFFRKVTDTVGLWLAWMDRRLIRKPGSGGAALVGLALLSLVLSPLVYLLRFGFTVLLEPQVNPVKHFPVVSVGHKIMLLLVPSVAQFVNARTGWAFDYCLVVVFTVIGLIPGFLGFMVWEIKENWRLYKANMPETLTSIQFGSHGETARGMLAPGFHSGTIPALFRRARHGTATTDGFDHAHHGIERFFQGSFLTLLEGTRGFPRPELKEIRLTKSSFSALVLVNGRTAELAIRWRGHWLEADWEDNSLRDGLNPECRAAWDDARTGLWLLSGAEVLAPPLVSATGALAHGAIPQGCWIRTVSGEVRYSWDNATDPLPPEGGHGPRLSRGAFLLANQPIAWADWTNRWQGRSA